MFFFSTINDINYFYQRGLISEKEFLQLQRELFEVVSHLESATATGMSSSKTEISIYLLDVELDTSYGYFDSNGFECSLHYSYFVDTLSFRNPKICQMQKNWIESLKRYSTLITQTGEMQRIEFFKKQREIIQKM